MMNNKILLQLLVIALTTAGCTTDQAAVSYSQDVPIEGSLEGEWYLSANKQFRVKPPKIAPIIHIQDNYDSDSNGAGVTFKSEDATIWISVLSAKTSVSHNFDAFTSIYEKAYGENIEGDCIRKRTAIRVSGEKGIIYLLGYVGRGKQYVTKPSITSIFEKNGYFYQAIISSTSSFGPESENEQYKVLERNINKLLKNIEFTK